MNIWGIIQTAACANVRDSRCSDPAFALANPDLCPPQQGLIVKPAEAFTCALGSVQFRAFTVLQGVETDVTEDTTFSTSDAGVAVVAIVGSATGNATALAAGSAAINASYNGMTGSASLTVLAGPDCCVGQTVALLVLLDVTKSMTQPFGAAYATRMDFAKFAASTFIGKINGSKDQIGLGTFTDSGMTLLQALTNDTAQALAMVPGVVATQQTTGFSQALQAAISALNASSSDERVLVIISDGEDEDATEQNAGNDPLIIAQSFKQSGGIIMCLGTRASETANGFEFLADMATGGFFVNALPDAPEDAVNYLTGLLGYTCAGDCTPPGDIIKSEGALNYSSFADWTLSDGTVDLFGNGFFDLLPGNGMYVNLAGTSAPHNGKLTLTNKVGMDCGNDYRITLRIAGNQVAADAGASLHLQILQWVTDVLLLDQVLAVPDSAMPFTDLSCTFTCPGPAGSGTFGYFSIQENDVPSDPRWGILLKHVRFEDVTTGRLIFDGNFDSENEVYTPPKCGMGTTFFPGIGYYWGYDCSYNTCLSDPVPGQTPDPNALPDIEVPSGGSGGGGSTVYTSTQQACAACASGYVNLNQTPLAPSVQDTSPSNIQASLSGLTWQIPIDPSTSACVDPSDKTATIEGDPGTTYSAVLLIRGLVERKPELPTQSGITYVPGTGEVCGLWDTDAHPPNANNVLNPANPTNEYTLTISDPPTTYLLNTGGIYSPTTPTSYQFTVQIKGGATVTLRARTVDGLAWPNSNGLTIMPGSGTPPINVNQTPYFPGQFLQMDVTSVTGGTTAALPYIRTFTFVAATTVDNYTVSVSPSANNYPTEWDLEGSNNGTTWTLLDARTGMAFLPGQTKRFPIESPAAYTQYRLTITATSDGQPPSLAQSNLYSIATSPVCASATVTSANAAQDAYNAALVKAQGQLNCQRRYQSTQSFSATCATSGNPVQRSAVAYSYNSQAEADAAAIALAKADALAAAALC